ncbi:NADP-dependent phosphogluconate dehydrogenase [Brevibacterium casei]|uniref:NADP-dependent phosphogluconate dehydrogenase n=1 Tax=Brevibacterium casei TaxID=33889 RepID=UPI0021AFDAD8|nr:NADP-dependent phosphogluconate dehydrogenase [Brevibacterium casei]MCT1549049.1 NADP-dependent phosphogluconate dehydrogenase [Brevibacterium casei]MCT1558884.1 NADP-dependent phosphogluconate dehydrogenase [Brevibacterium casei]MCT2207259.1 NADP-dependent phosphogluconate dehydrogenase [Brevibacterium casei]
MNADVAVIGTGVMGSNLARNLARQPETRVAIYDLDVDRARAVAAAHPEAGFLVAETPAALAQMLTTPRVAILMVNAGPATDAAIADIAAVFEPGDIIVDGGNSLFTDTIVRGEQLEGTGIEFVGVGISGGEVGALLGPSMMVGGSEAAWQRLRPLLTPIAARAEVAGLEAPVPCVAHIGTDGAGHFAKMVHNGIEYADMQLIAEACRILRDDLGLSPAAISAVLTEWNAGELESYLIEVTAEVLAHVDAATGLPFVDIVADAAGAKGTGAWTAKVGLDLGVPVPTIAEAVFARSLSQAGALRALGADIPGPVGNAESTDDPVAPDRLGERIETVRQAVFAGKILAYVQGFDEIAAGAQAYGWDVDLGELASIWRAGCIIRARVLDRIVAAYVRQEGLGSLLADDELRAEVGQAQGALRSAVGAAIGQGIPVPALSSALAYLDGIRAPRATAAIIQAQRDFFGSHTYGRVDRPGIFHTLWSGDRSEVEL